MIKNLLLSLFTIAIISPIYSQDLEDDESCLMPDKKVMKVLKVTSDSKASEREKSMAYSEAIKLDTP